MSKIPQRKHFLIVLASFVMMLLLALSPSMFSSAQSVQSCGNQCQWTGPMGGYPTNWDYSSQTQFSASNIGNLQLSWVFPIPRAPSTLAGAFGAQGEVLTPLVVNGIVYTITNFHLLIAQSVSDGKVLWEKNIASINASQAMGVSPPVAAGHYHAIWYTGTVRGVPLIWVSPGNNGIYAFNALTGDFNLAFSPQVNNSLPGNFGLYGGGHPWVVIDEKHGVLVTGSGGTEGTDSARGFF